MDALWIWIHHNSWLFWLPALAIALTFAFVIASHRKIDLRTTVSIPKLPRWGWPFIGVFAIFGFSLIADPHVRQVMYGGVTNLLLPPGARFDDDDYFWLPAFFLSLIGVPLILKGLAFGWLRRIISSAVRCPRCKYDLASLAQPRNSTPITCPECGLQSPDTQALRRHPKRKRLIIIGACIVLTGLGISASRFNWNSALNPVKSWAIRTHANITGDLTYWVKNPSPLSAAHSLNRFDGAIQALLSNQPTPPGMPSPQSLIQFFTHSRPMDLKLDQALAPLTTPDQVLILRNCQPLLAQAASSKSRASDVAKQRLPLDDIIDRFFDAQGNPRRDLNPDTLIAEYQGASTPPLTKSAIIVMGSASGTNQHALTLFREEPDPRLRRTIRAYWFRFNWDEPLIEPLINAGFSDADLHRLLQDSLQTLEYQNYLPSKYQRPLSFAEESRLLTLLESDNSPLFSLPPDISARSHRLRAIAQHMQENHLSLLNPVHRARWQILINELNRLANQADSAKEVQTPASPNP